MKSLSDLWDSILSRLSGELSDTTIKTWFDEISVVTMEDSALVLHCSNAFKKNTVEARFLPQIKAALKDIFSTDMEVKILSDEQLAAYHGVAPDRPGDLFDSDAFTFETYVVGPQNKLAFAAAKAVTEKPGENYNPLFIYGDSGLGKTHLLYAIANALRKKRPEARIVYVKGDDFTNELIASIRENRNAEFREKYRQTDILLMDDIQFIAGKIQTQEEFFHTFNNLYESGRQIVLTSDRPPSEMTQLEDRLRTRFEWGLLADVQPPDFETRIAIIRRKAELLDLHIPDDVAEFIANRLKTNIRQLEGAVKKLKALKHFAGSPPSISMAQSVIKDILNNDQPVPITVEKIIAEVADVYGVTPEEIRSSKRSAQISTARKVATYVVREITQMPLQSIGTEFGGRDHSTIVYAINNIEAGMKRDANLKQLVEDIIKNIKTKTH